MIGSQSRRAKTPSKIFSASTKKSWRHLMLRLKSSRHIDSKDQLTNWPRFFGWTIFSSKVTATNPTRPKTHCVGREFSATGCKGTKKKHGLSSEWNEKTSQLRSLYSQTCFTYVLEHISESLEIFKLNLTNFEKSGPNFQPGPMFQEFSISRPPSFADDGNPHPPPWPHHPTKHSTFFCLASFSKNGNFFWGRISSSSFTIVFWTGSMQTKFWLAGFLGWLFGTAKFLAWQTILSSKVIPAHWSKTRKTHQGFASEGRWCLWIYQDDFCFYVFQQPYLLRTASLQPICLPHQGSYDVTGLLFLRDPGGQLGAKLVLSKTNLAALPLIFVQNLRTKRMFVSSLMSHEFSKLAAQKKAPGVSEGAE